MRKIKMLFLSLVFLFSLVLIANAQEASFYESNFDWIIRAYKDSVNTLMLEIRNKNGVLESTAKIDNGNNPIVVANNVASFSLAYNNAERKAYIFHQTASSNTPTLRTFAISSSAGTPMITTNYTSIHYMDINVNSYFDHTIIVKNEGTAAGSIGTISLSSQYFSIIGGTCQSNQSLNVNQTCTIVVRFAPQSNGQFSATLTVGTINISLYGNGTGGGGGSGADVLITRVDQNCWSNEEDIFTRVQLFNQGTSPATNFTVTVSIQRNNAAYPDTPPRDALLLGTWNVDIISPNETKILEKTVRFSGLPIHTEYHMIFKVNLNDVDNSNNEARFRCYLGR